MINRINTIIILIVIFLVSSCSSVGTYNKPFINTTETLKISEGMSRQQVLMNVGQPYYVESGKGGSEVEKLKGELKKITGKDVQLNIFEIKRPEIDAKLIGDSIAQQLRARISHRRAMKQAIASAMRVGAKGIKIKVSGRIGGAEMARSEQYKEGRTPLHTIRADIDYAICESQTIYGKIGVKDSVYKGEIEGKRNLSLNVGNKNAFKS